MGEFVDKLKEIAEPAAGPVLDMVSGIVLDGAVGAIVPGVGNLILSYKQQRTEKNLELFISQIVSRQDEFNDRLSRLDANKLQAITNHYFGIVTDYILDVKQQEKIDFIVNGYINLTSWDELNDDVVLMFYDTLEQLNLLDIVFLKRRYHASVITIQEGTLLDSLLPGQQRLINEKIERLGLFSSQNETKMDENIQNVVKYLQEVEKGKKNARMKINRISSFDSYRLTKFGSSFLEFFLNQYTAPEDAE